MWHHKTTYLYTALIIFYLDMCQDPHILHPLVQFHYYSNIHYHKNYYNLWQFQGHYNECSNHMSDIPYQVNKLKITKKKQKGNLISQNKVSRTNYRNNNDRIPFWLSWKLYILQTLIDAKQLWKNWNLFRWNGRRVTQILCTIFKTRTML